ncbi:MAG: fibronectin type III domain-containing protein [Candidatus Ratteibacteria bacterium]|nr:fibronectin type III domain-containing protein [Candidatus Ratteibacteria bacterium]
MLPIEEDGNLFVPVDTTVMGAGMAPEGSMYTENRATLHLHGGKSPWISDGTPHQWTVPAGETTSYPKGVSAQDVPDMVPTGDGELTFYWTNQQSSRLMFYHDHAYGITRLNVYVGEAAAYIITDDIEQALIDFGIIPAAQIPLVIQDRTFVDANTIMTTDPLWRWGSMPGMPMTGDLWMPHVYVPAQNPYDIEGVNPFGRWHYGPWFWPPTDVTHGPVENPYYDPINAPWEPPYNPGVPHPSMGMESFMDAPIVNGTVYPYLVVQPKAYRFRILNAANDRFWNLQLYEADPTVVTSDGRSNTEVKMVPAAPTAGFPETWPADGREGGVPDPATAGPSFIQIGTDSGFLPYPAVIPNQPITWNADPTTFNVGNVSDHALLLAPAERADVIVDFSAYAGKTLILYNDAPAAFPALDARYDYYTGAPDMTDIGGTVGALPGFGPNTRTIMQIRVEGDASDPFDLATLESMFVSTDTSQGVFAAAQDPIIVGQSAYDSAYNTTFPTTWPTWGYVNIQDNFISFQTVEGDTVTLPLEPKAIQDEMGEAFDHDYGRMSGFLGLELPRTNSGNQNFMLYPYNSPPVEVLAPSVTGTPIGSLGDGTQIWKITHNGVDTHPVHFHLYDVQLINRVGWDGIKRLPDANELGWKDTVRVSPLEDTIVALRPILPTLPFEIPNSVRLLDPTMPEGAILVNSTQADITGTGFMGFAPNGEPVDIINHYVNYGWEYVIHCHILSHEEMDMMHSVAVAVAPRAPSDLSALANGDGITLTWIDNSINETQFAIQRASDPDFTIDLTTFAAGMDATTYTDDSIVESQLYYYRVRADNVVGDTTDYTDPGINEGAAFPTKTASSDFSNTVNQSVGPVVAPGAPTNAVAVGGNAQATVSFSAPSSNGGSAITYYRVTSNPGGKTAVGGTSPITVTGLTNGGLYTFTVTATNAAGTGPASAPSNSVKLATVPGAPTNVSAVATGANGQAKVSFTAPASDGGNPIITYTVTCIPGGKTVTGNASPITITGLSQGTSYTFTVSATNAIGTGPESTPSNKLILDAKAPKVTVSVSPSSAVRRSGKTVTVKVKGKVSDSSGVNRASGSYSVSVSSGSKVPGGTFTISKNGSYSFKVKLSVSSARTYKIKVQAQDNAGNVGKASAKLKVFPSIR